MNETYLKRIWLEEESAAHMTGWDFSHIAGRWEEDERLPWDYRRIVLDALSPDQRLLDMGTGGGEFLLTLGHPPALTTVTEAYPPNVLLCREKLEPLGISVAAVTDDSALPLPDEAFDLVINRHESYDPAEVRRILKPGGLFITQQVGQFNDREFAELLLPGLPLPFPGHGAEEQAERFRRAGFSILRTDEAFRPIRFLDVGALVWFARICEWEFEGFSVEKCFPRLMEAQRLLERHGSLEGSSHRFLIVARKD
ncbi:MAG: class I SAM-dependent methyltransferase [Clostridia bacterium]|nr:class I SAM-dependent methyltransferase [Clostridia bacterium]